MARSSNEIFSNLASHMIEGMMFHEQLMNAYGFLGLPGYSKCHEYHYISETEGYIRLCRYYIEHFNRLVVADEIDNPQVIPESWFLSERKDVDDATRRESIEAAMTKWLDWEKNTLYLYEEAYRDFLTYNVAAAEFIKEYILDVDEEIRYAENELLHKRAMDYDIVSIIEEQEAYEKEFRRKIRKTKGGRQSVD